MSDATAYPTWLREVLRCPVCRAVLTDGSAPDDAAELRCATCQVGYPIVDGIPVLLATDTRTL